MFTSEANVLESDGNARREPLIFEALAEWQNSVQMQNEGRERAEAKAEPHEEHLKGCPEDDAQWDYQTR